MQLMKSESTSVNLLSEENYHIFIVPDGSPDHFYPEAAEDIIKVPETIMDKIIGVGRAYQLQFTAHVSDDLSARWRLNAQSIEWAADEIQFLIELLNDDHVNDVLHRILILMNRVMLNPRKLELAFEGP